MKYSPGRMILKKQIEWCFKNNVNKIDLGPGEFKYKNQWSNDIENYFKIIEAKSFLGKTYLLLYKLKNIFKGSDVNESIGKPVVVHYKIKDLNEGMVSFRKRIWRLLNQKKVILYISKTKGGG